VPAGCIGPATSSQAAQKATLVNQQNSITEMVGQVPLHASGCLLGYAFVVTEEVTDCIAVVCFVELVDVVSEH